jgi:hypothetical protein
MSEGQGSISFSGLSTNSGSSGGGGGGGTVTGANNGLSLNGTTVVLGNDLGDIASPAVLTNNRAIPLGGFGINFLEPGLDTGYFSIDSGGVALLNMYRGTLGLQLMEILTIQGKAGTNNAGNFWWTIDESYVAPDGQRDAVLQWGYNQDGVGGRLLNTECEVHYAIESHFNEAGGYQNEIHLETTAINGNKNRIFSFDVDIAAGGATGYFTCEELSFFDSNSGAVGTPYFGIGNSGACETFGPAASFAVINSNATYGQFGITTNNDGSVNINNGTTGADNVFTIGNSITVNNPNNNFNSVQANLINANGAGAFGVAGTVAGSAFALYANVTASGTLNAQVINSGAGNATMLLEAAAASAEVVFTNSAATEQWAVGLHQTDAGKFKIAAGPDVSSVPNLLTFTLGGQAGMGNETTPTALLHIGASPGTAGMGPLKLTAAALLAVPEDGLIEYDGTNFYKTIGAVRSIIV